MADDIVSLGGPERGSRRQADEAIEELFRAEYPRLVSSAFAVLGDGDLAERAAERAFIELWRHRRRLRDPGEAQRYLARAVTRLAGEAAGGRSAGSVTGVRGSRHPGPASGVAAARRPEPATGVPAGRSPDPVASATSDPPRVDTDRAWREFDALRVRGSATRRRSSIAAVAAAGVVAAISLPLLAHHRATSRPQPFPTPVSTYPRAVVARFALSGVMSVAGNSARAWAVRQLPSTIEQPEPDMTYQLVAIDLRTNAVLYRRSLGGEPRAIAVGAGRVWLTTPSGQAAGQIERIDPGSGRVIQILHLHAGPCTQLSFTPSHLYAACQAIKSAGTEFWRINPVTGRSRQLIYPWGGSVSSLIATPRTLWWVVDFSRLSGLANAGELPHPIRASVPGYQNAPPGSLRLAYDSGSIWALGQEEQLARIDANSGRLVRRYTYRTYDPTRAGGLDFLTASGGWLWFLDDGYPFTGVLRVSEVTGRPAGGVPIPPGSCGQTPCSLIFATPGSIWVPTAQRLIRIDSSTLAFNESSNRLDADSRLPG